MFKSGRKKVMELKTKQLVIRVISIVITIISVLTACLFASGIIPYEALQKEGTPTISLNVQIFLLCGLAVINILNLIFCNTLIKHKKLLIALNIIQLLFGGMAHIVGSIIILVLLFIGTTDVEEKKEVIQLPELEKTKPKRKWPYIIICFVLFTIFYTNIVSMQFLQYIPPIVRIIIVYGIQAIILGLLLKQDIKRDFIAFKSNFKTYMKYIFPKLGIFLIVYIIISLVVTLIAGQISTNQAQINELPIVFTAIMAIIFAPFIEEFMFRGLLRKSFKNDNIFIIFSTLLFGAAHVLYAEENLIMYIYIIPYALIGYFLARTYTKTNNIFTNVTVHFLWNTFCMVIMLLTKLIQV